ncbi:MAG: tripartite tricarboxylate transporter substrate binding protein [Desulfobacteraceae bacterium]|nr:tripartite tricarboxylate transporter substrate binding protein [Desulfobacteraceae bacterium]
MFKPFKRFNCFFGVFILACLIVTAGFSGAWAAEDYPSRTVTVINPFSPGGGTDIEIRNLMPFVQEHLGVPVIVKNVTGAAGTLGMSYAEKAKPDGYTIAGVVLPDVVLAQELQNSGTHVQDFKPIYGWFKGPMAVEVRSDSPYDTFEELIEASREKKLRAAIVGIGTIDHLHDCLIEKFTNTEFIKVPYGGGGPATRAALSGEADFLVGVTTTGLRFVRDGRLRMLTILGPERVDEVPDVPTIHELGYEDYPYIPFVRGAMAPPGVPEDRMAKLEEAFKKAVDEEGFRKVMKKQGRPVKEFSRAEMKEVVKDNFRLAKEYMPLMKEDQKK